MTAFTKSLSMILPSGDDDPRDGHSDIADTRKWTQERADVDGYWPDSGDTVDNADAGEHRKVTIRGLSADEIAALTASKAYIYRSTADGELYYHDPSGNTKKLTSGGKLNVSALEAVLLTGDQTVAGIKTFSSLPVCTTKATSDSQLANKEYVDDAIAAISYAAYTLVPGTRVTVDTLGAALIPNTVYKAAGPGELTVFADLDGGEYLRLLADPTSNPTTIRGRAEPAVGLVGESTFSVSGIISADTYVKLSSDGNNRGLAWIPFGSGGLVKV